MLSVRCCLQATAIGDCHVAVGHLGLGFAETVAGCGVAATVGASGGVVADASTRFPGSDFFPLGWKPANLMRLSINALAATTSVLPDMDSAATSGLSTNG